MKIAVLGLGFFTSVMMGATVVMAPATWLDFVLHRASGGVVSLGAPQGSLWSGTGTLQALMPQGAPVLIDRIRWSVVTPELWRGRLHLRVFSGQSEKLMADATLASSGLTLHSVQFDMPAALLGAFSPTLREAGLGGMLEVKASDLRVSGRRATGAATIVWNGAASGLTRVGALGNYRIEINGDANGLLCQFSTLDDAALKLTGNCRLTPGQPFRIDGTAEPAEVYKTRLVPLLRVFGRETRPGIYQLQLDPAVKLG